MIVDCQRFSFFWFYIDSESIVFGNRRQINVKSTKTENRKHPNIDTVCYENFYRSHSELHFEISPQRKDVKSTYTTMSHPDLISVDQKRFLKESEYKNLSTSQNHWSITCNLYESYQNDTLVEQKINISFCFQTKKNGKICNFFSIQQIIINKMTLREVVAFFLNNI